MQLLLYVCTFLNLGIIQKFQEVWGSVMEKLDSGKRQRDSAKHRYISERE